MAAWYLQLRHAHIAFAILSVAIFTVRGLLMLTNSRHVNSPWLKYPSYMVDTLLLTAALMLTTVIHQYPFQAGWLTMKVVLLVVYVVLGSIALKRGRTPTIRVVALVSAWLTVGFLFTVARAHHPLGIFAMS
ncbi:MAG TPA: SirB2 family protein [Steroidobacteraceae bacterium]|nr:SirB2 family protein [Steroidobacteraceae bacterium]